MTIMYFNGNQIGDRFLQFNPKREILPEIENTMVTVGRSNGGRFKYGRFKPRVITVDYDVSTISQREFEKRMAPLLYTTEPAKLVFSDAPNEYWMAKVDGAISLERAYYLGSGTINFIVPDGLAHAVTKKTFTQADDGTITIENAGTGPSYPVIHCVMHGDNGIVALANDSGGALQFGDPEDADKVEGKRSDRRADVSFRAKDDTLMLNTGALEYPTMANGDPNLIQGSVNWNYSDEAAAPVFDPTGAKAWHGPTLHGTIAANYAGTNVGDFHFKNRFGTYGDVKSRFRMAFILQSGDEAVITLNVRSSSPSRDELIMDCIVRGKLHKSFSLDRKKFVNGWQECQINRAGDKLTFVFGKIREYVKGSGGDVIDSAKAPIPPFTVDGIGEVPIDSYTLSAMQCKDSPVPELWWENTLFDWVNETEWNDIPNLYSDGDELILDVKQRKAFLNGMETSWYVVGNDWDKFVVKDKQMVITPIQSSWAEKMDVTVELEEAYI